MSANSSKALALSLAANIGIAIAKFVVFGVTRSSAMLTEASTAWRTAATRPCSSLA